MSFIKNIVNKLRINKIINRFNKLIRYYRFALTRSDEIVVEGEIVELSKTISEFDSIRINNVLDEYNRLLNDVKEHNEYLIQLKTAIETMNFDYASEINKPVHSREELFNFLTFLLKFECSKKQNEVLINNVKNYLKIYDDVVNQYEIHNKIITFLSDLKDKYYDLDDIKPYIDLNTSLNKYNKKYYNTPDTITKIKAQNEEFINAHINDPFFDNIDNKSLDYDQRRAVLSSPVSNLVIAGAGSGKTLTICGYTKYLIEKLGVNKNDILLLSYSHDSAKDLKRKIDAIFDNVEVRTFHSLGLEILKANDNTVPTIDDQFDAIIEKYFREELNNDPTMLFNVIQYYGLYLSGNTTKEKYEVKGDLYEDLKKNNFMTIKDQLAFRQSKIELKTIKKELVKSQEELAIANFYFINGIKYTYEAPYKEKATSNSEKRQYTPDFYLDDYGIYHEHYGVDREGRAKQYSKSAEQEYVNIMNWKRQFHRDNNTVCLETYSYEFEEGTVLQKLAKQLEEHGVKRHPLSNEEISDAINSIYHGKEFSSFITLVKTFINLYKAQYDDDSYFDKLEIKKIKNMYERQRAELFITICKTIYNYYKNYLKKENTIDFDDMILKSTKLIPAMNGYKYKYIVVDEFQDISFSRMRFLQSLINHNNSKLFAVGDDWQAIFRFSGCDVNIFLNFNKYFRGAQINSIHATHRNSQELQDIAVKFITKNPTQINKKIKSEKRLRNPVRILFYEDEEKISGLDEIFNEIYKINPKASILLLGRNNKDIETVLSSELKIVNYENYVLRSSIYKDFKITYKTAHKSKGLESEFVIIINADDNRIGFPNKIEDDGLLNLVLSSSDDYLYAEERRLWYVALTRTKSYTYILSSKSNPSEFVTEIEDDCYVMNGTQERKIETIKCPYCKSGKLILKKSNRSTFYGCSNYPYCNYTNNDIHAVEANKRCPVCGDFFVVRNGKYGSFYGCSSYPKCKNTAKL